jgi:ABC transporter substrate binding protein
VLPKPSRDKLSLEKIFWKFEAIERAFRYNTADGGVASYGPNTIEVFGRAAAYVDRILKGEKPADLPVQAPTKCEVVINLRTAKALGLEISSTLLRSRRRGGRIAADFRFWHV